MPARIKPQEEVILDPFRLYLRVEAHLIESTGETKCLPLPKF